MPTRVLDAIRRLQIPTATALSTASFSTATAKTPRASPSLLPLLVLKIRERENRHFAWLERRAQNAATEASNWRVATAQAAIGEQLLDNVANHATIKRQRKNE